MPTCYLCGEDRPERLTLAYRYHAYAACGVLLYLRKYRCLSPAQCRRNRDGARRKRVAGAPDGARLGTQAVPA